MPTLLEITDELLHLLDQLEAAETLDEETARLVDAYLLDVEQALEDKIDRYVALMRELELRAKARREEAERLLARARRDEERLAFLRERLIAALRLLGRTKLETTRYRVSIYQSGQPPVELRLPPEALPDELVRIERKPDLRAIRQALEEGRIGEDVAVLGERKWTLRIS